MKTFVTKSVLMSSLITGIFFTACNNTKNSENMKNHELTDNIYACPMHPEITGKEGDNCSKCGMALVAASGENSEKTKVILTTEPQDIEAGIPVQLTLEFKEKGKTVPLAISHEKKVHLMAVNEDLTWFRHIHPVEQTDSSYTLSETFPNGGNYFLFADFKPQGAASIVDKKEISVKGNTNNSKVDFSTQLVFDVDGYTVTLENGNDFKTGRTQPLQISVEKEGKKLSESDIELYLGATAHIAMISKENKDFLHIHPLSSNQFPIYAQTQIEKPGIYRIWVEFQTNGKVHTATFTVNIIKGEQTDTKEHHH